LKYEQTDLREGTYPEGSVWRPVGISGYHALRRDKVIVPSNITPGDYVLGWRWDVAKGLAQVWVSCSSIRLVPGGSERATEDNEDYEELLYTDEEYAELEAAFENEENEDYEELLYTDEDYADIETALEN